MMRRVGLYGGTFDPVHAGHLAIARRLHELFALDEVLLIPAYVAPHKRHSRVTPAFHRYAMLALATQHDTQLRVSTIELDCPERPFTIETVRRVQAERQARWRTFFIMGADSWLEIETWREWERMLSLTDVIVVTRPGYEIEEQMQVLESAANRMVDVRGRDRDVIAGILDTHASATKVYLTDAVEIDVEATAARELARRGDERLREFVPASIADYIVKYGLYKDENRRDHTKK
jgi:nicotinate-nucleotide adenylyltransferase